jgi:hypothetical protein
MINKARLVILGIAVLHRPNQDRDNEDFHYAYRNELHSLLVNADDYETLAEHLLYRVRLWTRYARRYHKREQVRDILEQFAKDELPQIGTPVSLKDLEDYARLEMRAANRYHLSPLYATIEDLLNLLPQCQSVDDVLQALPSRPIPEQEGSRWSQEEWTANIVQRRQHYIVDIIEKSRS